MADEGKIGGIALKDLQRRCIITAVKVIIILVLYSLAMAFLLPIFDAVPDFIPSVEAFAIIYVVLMVIGDLTVRTICQPVVGCAKAMLAIFFIIFALGETAVSVTTANFSLTLDMGLVFSAGAILSLFGLVSAILETISFLNERAEKKSGFQL